MNGTNKKKKSTLQATKDANIGDTIVHIRYEPIIVIIVASNAIISSSNNGNQHTSQLEPHTWILQIMKKDGIWMMQAGRLSVKFIDNV